MSATDTPKRDLNELQARIDSGVLSQQDYELLRSLTMEERSQMLVAACRTAMELECQRVARGLPPTESELYPQSTWDFLRKQAKQCREDN
jgi:hypothetical protein